MNHEINKKQEMNFNGLVAAIQQIHAQLSKQASFAVNVSLTMRNWFVGYYIQEYEQHGADKAKYGQRLMERLSEELKKLNISRTEARELRRYRQFYQTYPQIRESVSPRANALGFSRI